MSLCDELGIDYGLLRGLVRDAVQEPARWMIENTEPEKCARGDCPAHLFVRAEILPGRTTVRVLL